MVLEHMVIVGAAATATTAAKVVGDQLKQNLNELHTKVASLIAKQNDVKKSISDNAVKQPLKEVSQWLKDCGIAIDESKKFFDQEGNPCIKKGVGKRVTDGPKVLKALLAVSRLLRVRFEAATSQTVHPRDFVPAALDFIKPEWFDEAFLGVMGGKHKLVCVFGRPGMGLSTFLRFVSREIRNVFDVFIFLGQEIDGMDMVQEELRSRFNLWSLEESRRKSSSQKCSLITRYLAEKDFSIIFETLTTPLRLDYVGIPFDRNVKVIFGTNRVNVMDDMKPQLCIDLVNHKEEDRIGPIGESKKDTERKHGGNEIGDANKTGNEIGDANKTGTVRDGKQPLKPVKNKCKRKRLYGVGQAKSTKMARKDMDKGEGLKEETKITQILQSYLCLKGGRPWKRRRKTEDVAEIVKPSSSI